MERQLNFHAAAADIAELEARIRKLETMAILHARSTTAKPRVLPSLSFAEGPEQLLCYYLVRERELPKSLQYSSMAVTSTTRFCAADESIMSMASTTKMERGSRNQRDSDSGQERF